MLIQIFHSDNGDMLPFQNDINCWIVSEQPEIVSITQSESLHLTAGGEGDYRNVTITILYKNGKSR